MENLDEVIAWGQSRAKHWVGPQKGRLNYLEAIANQTATYSKTVSKPMGPDDVSPFGRPVYLMDMSTLELKEYLLSGLSKKEQSRIFSS